MSTRGNEFGALLSQYNELWLKHVAQFEQQMQLLKTMKEGMELLLLVSSFLLYYLIDCIAQVIAMPLPFVR